MGYRADIRASWRSLPCFALMGALWGGFHAYVPQVKAASGASDWAFGMALLVSALASLAAASQAPRLERWLGARALAACGALMVLSFLMVAMIGSIAGLVAVLCLVGVSLGLMDVLMNAQVSRDETLLGRSLMNLNHGFYSLAYAAAALAAAPLRAAEAGPGVFYAAVAVPGLVLLWRIRSAGPSTDAVAGEEATGGAVPSVAIWGGIIVLLAFGSENAVESWSALHVERSLGGNPAQGALGPAAMGLTMAFGRLAAQRFALAGRESRLIGLASLIAAAGALLAALAWSPMLAWAGFALAGLGLSVLVPMALSLIGRLSPPASRSRAVARGTMIGYAGFFFGPPLMGAVAELAGLRAVYLVIAVAVAMVPLALMAMRHRGR